MRHEWKTPGGSFFSIDSERLEDRGPLGEEILRLAYELKVERAHREAAERQRDDRVEEIRCLRAEREQLIRHNRTMAEHTRFDPEMA